MTLPDRVSFFLKQKKLSQVRFCNKTGFSQHNLSKFLTGAVKHVKVDLAMVIAEHYPEINLRWLLLEEGEMFITDIIPNNEKLKKEINQLKKEVDPLKKENAHLKDLIKSKDKIIELLEKE